MKNNQPHGRLVRLEKMWQVDEIYDNEFDQWENDFICAQFEQTETHHRRRTKLVEEYDSES